MRVEVPVGTVLAGFRVESLIAEGAMGTLYLAESPDGQRVALKLLSPELAREERFRQRFLRESELAAGLDHPHVVRTIASGEEDGLLFLAMAYVDGSDLREILRREGPLEPERTIDLLAQVADGLDAAHASGLVHRDVKPGNILVCVEQPEEQAYVCDFGLARHATSVSSLTGERGFVGTIDYISPEQVEGGPIDGRADVYSLGCVLFECLAGERPFDRESELSVVFAHLNEPPPAITELRPELPSAFDALFERALAKSPNGRFQTCGDLIRAARAALEGKPFARVARRRKWALIGAAAAIVALAAAAAGVLATRGTSAGFAPGTALVDLASGKQIASITPSRLPSPGFPLRSGGHFWLFNFEPKRFVEIEAATGKIVTRFPAPRDLGDAETYQPYAVHGRTLWVAGGDDLVKMDTRAGNEVERLHLDSIVGQNGRTEGVTLGGGLVWVSRDVGRGQVVAIDPTTRRVRQRFDDVVHHQDIAYADGLVWATDFGGVTLVDTRSQTVSDVPDITHTGRLVAVGAGFGWTSDPAKGVVYKIDRTGHVAATYPTGSGASSMSYDRGTLWVANQDDGSVTGIDAITGTERTLRFGHPVGDQAVGDGVLLVTLQPGQTFEDRIDALTGKVVRVFSQQGSLGEGDEPALNTNVASFQVDRATCAGLLTYPDVPAPAGLQLRPEVAAAMPTMSPDGRTYTFTIRPGYRFSPPANEPVTAETFRHTIERALSPKLGDYQPAAYYVDDIAGEEAFRQGRTSHLSGLRATSDRLSITLTRRSPDFLERLSLPFFCPVPRGTPIVRGAPIQGKPNFFGGGTIPSAGPYYIADYYNDEYVILKRNPNYSGPRARPVDAIALREGVDAGVAAGRVQHAGWDGIVSSGHNGSTQLDPLFDPSGELASRRVLAGGDRYVAVPLPEVDFVAVNSSRGPFADPTVRRAAALAIDRGQLAVSWNDAPAGGLLPPTFPGALRGVPGGSSSPHLADARALMRGRSLRAVLATYKDCDSCAQQARAIRADLGRIGIDVRVREEEDAFGIASRPGAAIDLFVSGTRLDYPDSASFLEHMFLRDVPSGWISAPIRQRVEAVSRLSGPERQTRAAALAAQLASTDVPVIAWGNAVQGEFFSPRLGCRRFPPMGYGVSLAALCREGV